MSSRSADSKKESTPATSTPTASESAAPAATPAAATPEAKLAEASSDTAPAASTPVAKSTSGLESLLGDAVNKITSSLAAQTSAAGKAAPINISNSTPGSTTAPTDNSTSRYLTFGLIGMAVVAVIAIAFGWFKKK